jgi:1-acyl-sn-glycerol-3-phosphate acyltransferase
MLPLQALTQINSQDLLTSLGLEKAPGRRLLEALSFLPARRFARQVLTYDHKVEQLGLVEAARLTLPDFIRRLDVVGRQNLPRAGPTLFLSNHPGMTDTLALFASLNRPDLKIIAAERPFLRHLPCTSRHLIFVTDSSSDNIQVIRTAVKHLRQGGAVLTFPAGQIEPDPAVRPGAVESLASWSESAALFARLVPQAAIVPVLVSGVLWDRAMNHPLTRLRRDPAAQERLGATLQLLAQSLFNVRPVTVRVQIGPALDLVEASDLSPQSILKEITAAMRQMVDQLQVEQGQAGRPAQTRPPTPVDPLKRREA